MDSTLRRQAYNCDGLGRPLDIQQLSALGLSEIIDARESNNDVMLAAITCKHGVVGWREFTPVEILEAHTPETILELADAIDKLSSPGPKKNSGTDPADDSFSGSPLPLAKTHAK